MSVIAGSSYNRLQDGSTADQAFEHVVPSLCDVGPSGKSEEGSISLVPGPLVKERGSCGSPNPGVVHVVSK